MATEQPLHSPSSGPPQRPKGILKNRSTSNVQPTPITTPAQEPTQEEKDLVLSNTLHNAGHRRSSSRPSQPSTSRRQSGSINGGSHGEGETSPRLKWDEANLYLAEQEREEAGPRMKIDEPKTPFASQYNPGDDEMADGAGGIDAEGLMVDEVDKKLLMSREKDIPDLDIGEAADASVGHAPHGAGGDKRVIVDENMADAEDDANGVRHGEEGGYVSEGEKEKHRHFEEMRKKHYEMRNIKNVLGHPELIDDDEDVNGQ